ncbi:MAG: hypothetical protein HY046_00130 [Acidobacteria bacterium]|nr:hypothetical protein [Acidobacteriota bacterium]
MGDDFSESVKRALASRVGNLCSNPDCRTLTSGPRDDPAKAVNVGVAAHITAASPKGPRYDPDLLPEERSSPSNGVWLCQNCGKLVDNDSARFTGDLIRKWKNDSETEARNRVGKTAVSETATTFDLEPYDKVRINPIIPRSFEQSEWMLEPNSGELYRFKKLGCGAYVDIPKSFIEKVHRFGGTTPSLVELNGRLQLISIGHRWELFPQKPRGDGADEHGFSNAVDFDYVQRQGLAGKFRWFREDNLPHCLGQGWHIFYGEDGRYLRRPGPDVDQILLRDPS